MGNNTPQKITDKYMVIKPLFNQARPGTEEP